MERPRRDGEVRTDEVSQDEFVYYSREFSVFQLISSEANMNYVWKSIENCARISFPTRGRLSLSLAVKKERLEATCTAKWSAVHSLFSAFFLSFSFQYPCVLYAWFPRVTNMLLLDNNNNNLHFVWMVCNLRKIIQIRCDFIFSSPENAASCSALERKRKRKRKWQLERDFRRSN